MSKAKLTEKEKALLRRKILHGGAYGVWTNRVAFTKNERLMLDSIESRIDKALRRKKKAKKD